MREVSSFKRGDKVVHKGKVLTIVKAVPHAQHYTAEDKMGNEVWLATSSMVEAYEAPVTKPKNHDTDTQNDNDTEPNVFSN